MAKRRIVRKGPGSSPLNEQRELCPRLMKQGYSNAKACRDVGVNSKTATESCKLLNCGSKK